MVSKVGGTPSTQAGGFMPSPSQIKQAYSQAVNKALADGTAKQLKNPPAGIEKFQSTDITPKGELGVGKQVYAFKGELYLKSTVVAPNAKPTWTKIGPMPMF